MPNTQIKGLPDDEIIETVNRMTGEAVGFNDSKLFISRSNVLRYYDGQSPRRSGRSNSSYISQDVYDSVEQAAAAIVEVFAGETGVGSFEAEGPEDMQSTEEATRYADYVAFRRNNGHQIIQMAVKDGLMNRNAIGKVYWEEEVEYFTESFEDLPPDTVLALTEQETFIEVEELERDKETELLSGTLLHGKPKRGVRIENIAPEEFGISPRARSLEDAAATGIVFHRVEKTISDLREMGFSEEEIDLARSPGPSEIEITDNEIEQRFDQIDDTTTSHLEQRTQPQTEEVWVYESYMNLDVDGEGVAKMWKITSAGDLLIDKEVVNRLPFITFAPVPRQHSFWGNNWAERLISVQNAKTILTRGILDHTVATNRPRYQVVKGTLRSAQELMDDRFGGIVNVNRPDGILPLPQGQLNQFTFPTLQLLQSDLEDTSGVSSLMTGLNKDAVSKQNSADLVNQLTTLSQTRLKIMARNFAEQWIKPMYKMIYELAVENDDQETIIEINGTHTPVNPTTWLESKDFTVEIAVGYGEKEKEAQKWLNVDQLLTQSAPGQYGPEQKMRVLGKALGFMGIRDVSSVLLPEPPPPQPDPLQVAQVQLQERELAIKEQEMQIKIAEMSRKGEIDAAEIEMKAAKQRADFALASDKMDLAEKQHADRHALAEEELAAAKANDPKGILSANS